MDDFADIADLFLRAHYGAYNAVERVVPAYLLITLAFLAYLRLAWASCADWIEFVFIAEDLFTQLVWPFILDKARFALLYTTGGLKLARYDFQIWCRRTYRRTFLPWLVRNVLRYYRQNKRAIVEHWPRLWSHIGALFYEKCHELRALGSACLNYILRISKRAVQAYIDLCLWPLQVIWRIVKFYFRLFLEVTCFCIELYTRPVFFVLHVVGRVVPRVEQAVRNMEAKAEDLLTALKNPNLSIDTKLNYLLALKSDIKQKVVPAYLTPHLFHGIRLSITSQHAPIYVAGFSTLGHLLKRLYLQEQHGDVAYYARDLYPILLERLGDHKERVRTLASQAFTDLWPAANAEVEKHVLGTALNGKNPKAKEMSMLWLTLMSKEHGVLFRAHVPKLVACLEDADSNIRETAKTTVVELFKNAPVHAKLNLKTEMIDRHVRKSIMNAILPLLGLDEEDLPQRPASRADPSRYRTHRVEEDRSLSRMGQRKADPRPVSRVEQRPVAKVEHRPVSRVEQRPVAKVEPRPVSRVEQRPVSESEQPTSVVEQRPASRVEQRPATRVEQHITATVEAQPASIAEQRPASRVEQRPASRVEQRPASRVEQRPASRVEQRPATRVEQHITATVEAQPASIAEQRPASRVEQHITSTVEPQPTSIAEQRTAHRVEQVPVSEVEHRPTSEMVTVPGEHIRAGQSHVSEADESPKVQPYEVHMARDLENIVRKMAPHFEGRETEENWFKRDEGVNLLRRVTAGNAPHDYPQHYVAAVKSILDGIFKVVNSLRTQLATTGCCFIQEMATVCGSQIDPLVEPTMQNMVKICSGMKKITAGLGNTTVDTLLLNVSYNSRLLQHVASSFDDKSMQLRLYAAGWLKTLINKQAHNKSTMEHSGGMDLMVKSLRKGLSDANPGVREAMRSTFWAFASVWPARSEGLLADLDKKTRTLLEKDPSNPRNKASVSQPGPAQRRPATSGSTTPGRSALKQAIAARKRAHQQTAQPLPRPGSAHAVLSDPRPEPAQPEPRSTLSSAPVRRGVKVTRPATAEPGRRPAPTEGRPNQARVASRWHPSSPTRAAPPANPERSPSVSPTKSPRSPWKAPLKSMFRQRKTNEDLELTSNANRTERKAATGTTWYDDIIPPNEAPGVSLDSNRTEQKEATDAHWDASHTDQKEATGTTFDVRHTEQKEATGTPLKANRTRLTEVADVTLNANRAEQQEVTDVTIDGIRIGKQEATPIPSPALMPNHELASEPDVGRIVLTIPEMELTRKELPTSRFRRVTYEGRILDLRDPLTDRWYLVERTVVGRRDVKAEYADIQYARRMIASAKAMIQTHTEALDSYLYRKVQSLIAYHTDLFIGEHQYDEFLSLLLAELARNPGPLDDAKKIRIALDYKTQVLKTIRFMFVYNEHWYADRHADILMANMEVRRYFEPRHFLYTALNYAAEDLLYACPLPDLVTAMVRNVNLLGPGNLQGVIMAVKYITKLLRILNLKGIRLDYEILQAMGRYVMECMSNGSTEVRRYVMDLCTQVRDMAGTDAQFWELLGQPTDQHARYVINYYVYRKPVKLDDGGMMGLGFESDSDREMM